MGAGGKNRLFYTWNDSIYRDFMIEVLTNLEPICAKENTILYNELDEFGEIIFVQKGIVSIGYELNKMRKMSLKYIDHCVIGAYGVTFNLRSQFVYMASTQINGYFIRKSMWYMILNGGEV